MPQRLIDGTSFGPEVLKVARKAFDEAWLDVAARLGPEQHDEARTQLAEIVMSVTRENSTDAGMIRDAALRALARHFPTQLDGAEAEQDAKKG